MNQLSVLIERPKLGIFQLFLIIHLCCRSKDKVYFEESYLKLSDIELGIVLAYFEQSISCSDQFMEK